MRYKLKSEMVYTGGVFLPQDISFSDPGHLLDTSFRSYDTGVSFFPGCVVLPGLADVHVHFREPGFFYKETIATGSSSAARGGYTDVCTMPNLSPAPDSVEHLRPQLEAIQKDAIIRVHPYGTITMEQKGQELAALEELAPHVVGFSDDGRGVQDRDMMKAAMLKAKSLGKVIAAHCEDNALLRGGYIHDGAYAKAHGYKGICSESEWGPIARDLELVRKTGCAYHICHISTKESVALIRKAKAEGLDVTCETGPHYLVFSDQDLQEDGRFKMNPPIRDASDRQALLEGLRDGTIDMIATDHAPHSAEEKGKGLAGSAMGVVGLETAFPVLYTHLVKTGIISLEKLVELMALNPRQRFGLPFGEDYSVWDLNAQYDVDPQEFLSKGKATPFAGMHLFGRNRMTIMGGNVIWTEK